MQVKGGGEGTFALCGADIFFLIHGGVVGVEQGSGVEVLYGIFHPVGEDVFGDLFPGFGFVEDDVVEEDVPIDSLHGGWQAQECFFEGGIRSKCFAQDPDQVRSLYESVD